VLPPKLLGSAMRRLSPAFFAFVDSSFAMHALGLARAISILSTNIPEGLRRKM
jgi:hypothetical protein